MTERVKVNPVSPRTFQLLDMDTIESQFPVMFEDGGGFPMFTAYCAQCSQPIENEHLRGQVLRSERDVFTVEAAGACFACNIATPVFYRLHPDGTMTGVSPQSGKWEKWDKQPKFFRSMLHRLFPGRFL